VFKNLHFYLSILVEAEEPYKILYVVKANPPSNIKQKSPEIHLHIHNQLNDIPLILSDVFCMAASVLVAPTF
jgi:hypothetical protein